MDKWTRFNNSCLSLPQALKITSWDKQSFNSGGISDGFSFKIQDCFESVTPSSDEKVKTFLEKACKALIAAKVEFLGRTCWGDSTVWEG